MSGSDSLNSSVKEERERRRASPPRRLGHTSNRMNVRWLYTSVGSVSGATPAVFNNFIIGKEAYAVVHLRSETGKKFARVKPNLIDLEAYSESHGDRDEPEWDVERLSGLAA